VRNSQRTTLALLALMTLVGGLLTITPPHTRAAETQGAVQKLTVTEWEPVAAPSQGATLYLGIETRAKDSRSAQSDAEQALERLRQGLRAAGVPAANVKVQGYRISASSRQPAQGSVVWQNVVAQVPKSDQMGPAIDAAVASGATMVQGSADQYQAPSATERAAAVSAAVRAARSDAQAMSASLGMPLGNATAVKVQMRHTQMPGPRYIMYVQVTFGG